MRNSTQMCPRKYMEILGKILLKIHSIKQEVIYQSAQEKLDYISKKPFIRVK